LQRAAFREYEILIGTLLNYALYAFYIIHTVRMLITDISANKRTL